MLFYLNLRVEFRLYEIPPLANRELFWEPLVGCRRFPNNLVCVDVHSDGPPTPALNYLLQYVQVKQSRYRPGVAQRVPGS